MCWYKSRMFDTARKHTHTHTYIYIISGFHRFIILHLYFDRIHGAYEGIWIWDNYIYIDMILFVTVQFGGNLTQIK